MYYRIPTHFNIPKVSFPFANPDFPIWYNGEHFVFVPFEAKRKVKAKKLIPDIKIGSVTLSPACLTDTIIWQRNEACIYFGATGAYYMPNCPFPGYIPASGDEYEYYTGTIDDFSHGRNFTFNPAGTASKTIDLSIDWGDDPYIDSGDGVFVSSTGKKSTFGTPHWYFEIYDGFYDIYLINRTPRIKFSGSETFYFSDDGLTLFCAGWEKQMCWRASNCLEPGSDATFIWEKLDESYEYTEENIEMKFSGYESPESCPFYSGSRKIFIAEVQTWH